MALARAVAALAKEAPALIQALVAAPALQASPTALAGQAAPPMPGRPRRATPRRLRLAGPATPRRPRLVGPPPRPARIWSAPPHRPAHVWPALPLSAARVWPAPPHHPARVWPCCGVPPVPCRPGRPAPSHAPGWTGHSAPHRADRVGQPRRALARAVHVDLGGGGTRSGGR